MCVTFYSQKYLFVHHHIAVDGHLEIPIVLHVHHQIQCFNVSFRLVQIDIVHTNVFHLGKLSAKVQIAQLNQ